MQRVTAAAPATSPETLTVDANGLTFGALAWGAPDDPLVLLLHGYPDSAHTWRHVGPQLAARGRRVVAPFMRGYAPTGLAPDDHYFLADLAADAVALRHALGGDDRAALVGHDWGSATVWTVTAHEPSAFARYVALSIPPGPALLTPWTRPRTLPLAMRQARMSWYFGYNQLPVESRLDRAIPKLWRDWSPGYDGAEDAARALEALDPPGHRRAALRYYRDNLVRGLVRTLTTKAGAPALYLHGEDDGCLHVDVGTGARFPAGSRVERIAGAGHFLPLEAPDRVAALIGDWIDAPAPG